jgi:transcriptional regulator with XRE-family HTH domain
VPKNEFFDEISSHAASLLKEEREKQGFSLKALSRKAGLARQTITFIEHEVQSPSLDTLLRIAFALDIDLTKIIDRAYKRARKENTVLAQQKNNKTRKKSTPSG